MNVFVTIWNRFTWAIPLLDDFAKAGLTPIVIDNASTYEPCRNYLDNECKYQVIKREKNDGPWAFFVTELYQQYRDRYFMVSDSDQSIAGIPNDWVDVLMKGLELHTQDGVWKSGLSQRIDNLPDNPYANEIREYEKNYYTNITKHGYYQTFMDIGIAIYDRSRRGENPIKEEPWYAAVRSPLPYVSEHLDWSMTPDTLRDEDKYYLTASGRAHEGWLFNWRTKFKANV